jgi:tetratricopeptide (TPR) repeat protein
MEADIHHPETGVPGVGKERRDYRIPTLAGLFLLVAALGYGISQIPVQGVQDSAPPAGGDTSRSGHAPVGFSGLAEARQDVSAATEVELLPDSKDADGPEARKILKEAGDRIKAKKYNEAIGILNQSQALMKKYPETYVVLGRALEGRGEPAPARDFYLAAINRDPYLSDAYWGFATTSEALGELESALGAMRSFLHTEPVHDQSRLRIAQARSAIWEWESQLGRGPWGPTKGIPPGFTAEEVKRDGRGVGTKMPIPGTEGSDGKSKAELKHGKKFELFKQ